MEFFHIFVIPFVAVLIVTAGKFFVDNKDPVWADANNMALDMVLPAAGAITVIYTQAVRAQTFVDVCVGDAGIGVILLLIRFYRRKKSITKVRWYYGVIELMLGVGAIAWTVTGV